MCFACVLAAITPTDAAADLIAYWNFNSYDGSATIVPASLGAGTLTITGFPDANLQNLAGTTINALAADPAGASLTVTSNVNNGDFLTLEFSMSGYEDLVLTYATRRTSTGFNSDMWSYSTDGLTFVPFGLAVNPTTSTTFDLITRDFSSIATLDDESTVYLRYEFFGATNSSGNNRIDNIQLNASAASVAVVPEPSTMALMSLGLVGLTFVRRRFVRFQGRFTFRPVCPM
jgi:hypothetical protein